MAGNYYLTLLDGSLLGPFTFPQMIARVADGGVFRLQDREGNWHMGLAVEDGQYRITHLYHDRRFARKLRAIVDRYSKKLVEQDIKRNYDKYASQPPESRYKEAFARLKRGMAEYDDMVQKRDDDQNDRALRIGKALTRKGLRPSPELKAHHHPTDGLRERLFRPRGRITPESGYRCVWARQRLRLEHL